MELKFDLSDQSDQEAFNRIALATRMAGALWDWDQYMRQVYREKVPFPTAEELSEKWNDVIYGINFEDIYT